MHRKYKQLSFSVAFYLYVFLCVKICKVLNMNVYLPVCFKLLAFFYIVTMKSVFFSSSF